jgi:transcriptional regulator with XRE-family HTH domain
MKDIAERIKFLRKSMGLTQAALAEKIGVTRPVITMIETDKISLSEQNINLIRLNFGINDHWLRTGEGDMYDSDKEPVQKKFFEIFDSLLPEGQENTLVYMDFLYKSHYKGSSEEVIESAPAEYRVVSNPKPVRVHEEIIGKKNAG